MNKRLAIFTIFTGILVSGSLALAQSAQHGQVVQAVQKANVTVSAAAGSVTQTAQSTQQTQNQTVTQAKSEGFTLAPSDGSSTVHGFTFSIAPGGQTASQAYIKNFADQTVHFSLYGADPTLSNTGSLAYKTHDQSTSGPGTWIKFAQPEIDLGPGEEKVVPFTVDVPPSTPPGQYRAGITIEKAAKDTNNPGITIATRVVNHAMITVTGSAAANGGQSATGQTGNFQTYYFWVSLGLFIMSLALLIWTLRHEKKSKQGHRHEGAHHGTAHGTHHAATHGSEHGTHGGTNHGAHGKGKHPPHA